MVAIGCTYNGWASDKEAAAETRRTKGHSGTQGQTQNTQPATGARIAGQRHQSLRESARKSQGEGVELKRASRAADRRAEEPPTLSRQAKGYLFFVLLFWCRVRTYVQYIQRLVVDADTIVDLVSLCLDTYLVDAARVTWPRGQSEEKGDEARPGPEKGLAAWGFCAATISFELLGASCLLVCLYLCTYCTFMFVHTRYIQVVCVRMYVHGHKAWGVAVSSRCLRMCCMYVHTYTLWTSRFVCQRAVQSPKVQGTYVHT